MKSVRTKIVMLVLLGSILSAVLVGAFSIGNTKIQIQQDSTDLMNQNLENSRLEIDAVISRIAQSVETMADCALNGLTDLEAFQTDADYVKSYTDDMENILLSAAEHTEGAITAYIRYNPEFTEPTSGLFLSRDDADSEFEMLVPTDFSIYDKSDTAHVGWYYIPVENRVPTWMSPYLNENLQVYMVSYVVPLYKDGVSIGIVGMDIDFGRIQQLVDKTTIYKSGYAFLVNDSNEIMYHKSQEPNTKLDDLNTDGGLDRLCAALGEDSTDGSLVSYRFENVAKKMAHRELQNGMRLVLTAPVSEINASENRLILQILVSTILAVAISVIVSLLIVRGIVKPLEELNRAASRIAEGELDVSISCQSKDEIGTLAESISLTVERLKGYINYIREISEVLGQMAEGNLVFELHYDYTGEFSVVKEALLHISQSLNHTLLEISNASEQVTGSSEQVSQGAKALAEGANEQAASVQELSATLHEISDKVKENARNAEAAYGLAQEAGISVAGTNQDMEEITVAMQRIAQASEKINQIVKTVEGIAAQTNILALNASVESARAGEAGKGFAVVAHEVGSLATEVNRATKEIARLTHDAAMEIEGGTTVVGKAEVSLQAMSQKSAEIVEKLQEIADASQWQAASIAQVNEGIGQISAVVETNSATSEESASASQELSGQAELLRDLIRYFKLDSRRNTKQ